MADGNQWLADTNRRVFFSFDAGENVQALRLRSDGAAFEIDSIVASPAGAVPEPATWRCSSPASAWPASRCGAG